MFLYEPSARFLFLFVLIPIISYYPKFRDTSFYLYLLMTVTFIAGSISLIIGVNYDFIRQFIELQIWGLLLYSIIVNGRIRVPGISYLLAFLVVCCISAWLNDKTIFQVLLFWRRYLFIVAAFYLFWNLNLKIENQRNLVAYVIFLSLSQILVNLQKLVTIGQQEDYIGSMAVSGGSLTTVFSLVGIAFSFSFFLAERKKKYLWLIIGFLAFAIIGEKRGIVLYTPLLILIQYFLFSKRKGLKISTKAIRNISGIFLALMIFLYVAIRLNPSLNPAGKMGGDVDFEYLTDYATRFTKVEDENLGGNDSFSRGLVYFQVFFLIKREFDTKDIYFGKGPADIMMSRFSEYYGVYLSEEEILLEKYGVGYGGRSGLIFTFIQVGVLGLLFYLFLIHALFKQVRKVYANTKMGSRLSTLALGAFGSYIVFLMDFLTYSRNFSEKISVFIPIALISVFIYSEYSKNIPNQKNIEE